MRQLPQARQATALCFKAVKPFGNVHEPRFWQCPRASPATAFFLLVKAFKVAVCEASKLPQPSATPFGNVHEPVQPRHFFLGRSRVPFARLQNSPNPAPRLLAMSTSQSSHGTLLFRAVKGAVCQTPQLSKPPSMSQLSHGTVLLTAFKDAVCQAPKPSKPCATPCLAIALQSISSVPNPLPGHGPRHSTAQCLSISFCSFSARLSPGRATDCCGMVFLMACYA